MNAPPLEGLGYPMYEVKATWFNKANDLQRIRNDMRMPSTTAPGLQLSREDQMEQRDR